MRPTTNMSIEGLKNHVATLNALHGSLELFISDQKFLGKMENDVVNALKSLEKIGRSDVAAFNDFDNSKYTDAEKTVMAEIMAAQIDAILKVQSILITARDTIEYRELSAKQFHQAEFLLNDKLEALKSLLITANTDSYLLTANKFATQEKTAERNLLDLEIGKISSKPKDKSTKVLLAEKIEQGKELDNDLSKLHDEKVTLLLQEAKNTKDYAPVIEERSRLESKEAQLMSHSKDKNELKKVQNQIGTIQTALDEAKKERQNKKLTSRTELEIPHVTISKPK